MNEYFSFVFKPYESYTALQIALEVIATCFGIASVLFSKNRNIWVYPTGIISTSIYIYLLYEWGLFGDLLINIYYTIMSIYGWFLWSKNTKDDVHVNVSTMAKGDVQVSSLLFLLSAFLVLTVYYYRPVLADGFNLAKINEIGFHYTWIDYTDTFTTSIFLVGMWLMAKRKIENWIFWIIGDLISIPMYLVKGYAITAFQYFVFLILAVMGYVAWKKFLDQQKKST